MREIHAYQPIIPGVSNVTGQEFSGQEIMGANMLSAVSLVVYACTQTEGQRRFVEIFVGEKSVLLNWVSE